MLRNLKGLWERLADSDGDLEPKVVKSLFNGTLVQCKDICNKNENLMLSEYIFEIYLYLVDFVNNIQETNNLRKYN